MPQLLDVNMLIALCDADHVYHTKARNWFKQESINGWATCPITENGFLRVLSNSGYPGSKHQTAEVANLLFALKNLPGHEFWEDDFSLVDEMSNISFDSVSSKSITDLYLLILALKRKGRLITLDRRINPKAIIGGVQALEVIS